MECWDLLCMLGWFLAVLAAAGWIGWGLCSDKLKNSELENLSLKKENTQLKKQVAFLEIEKATDLSRK